jgi:predicted DNA-binding transcriptional regulator AlpA
LADLLADPERVRELPSGVAGNLHVRLLGLQQALALRALAAPGNGPGAEPEAADRLLEVREAATRLGVSRDWLYRHARTLTFTVRLGRRAIRFSSHGLDRYIRQRQGR